MENIISFLIHNQFHLKQLLTSEIAQYRALLAQEDLSLHEDITNQFRVIVKAKIADEIAKNLGSNPEDINTVLDSTDMKDYILS